jgi:hypothetical protein
MRKTIALLTALYIVLSVSSAAAVDYWGGPPADYWSRGVLNSTYQHWEFHTDNGMMYSYEADEYDNPGSFVPYAQFFVSWEWGSDWECPSELDPTGTVDGWHALSDSSHIVIAIPNTDDPLGVKWIFIQITSSHAPTNVCLCDGNYESGTWPTGFPQIQWEGPAPYGGAWYTYNYGLWMYPNPTSECIVIEVPTTTVIDQIVVDTICTTTLSQTEPLNWGEIKALLR